MKCFQMLFKDIDTKNCEEAISWTNVLNNELHWAFSMDGFIYNGKRVAGASKAITGQKIDCNDRGQIISR